MEKRKSGYQTEEQKQISDMFWSHPDVHKMLITPAGDVTAEMKATFFELIKESGYIIQEPALYRVANDLPREEIVKDQTFIKRQ